MHVIDYAIVVSYLALMMAVGFHFGRRHADLDGYFVGGRKMGAGHIGLSIVATDVGGGFSIGLGGLGFAMGMSGSWLLFTGLIGAFMAAVFLVPRVKTLGHELGFLTFPDYLEHRFDAKTRLVAGAVSALGYAAFVGAQILAGAKLASVAFDVDLTTAAVGMAVVVVGYTALGGLEAVVYTDTIQWGVLLGGLVLVAVPLAYIEAGGADAIMASAPPGHLDFFQASPMEVATWFVTIIPIWFVANTLYQRIYATRDEKSARRAFYIAGFLEWPAMAFVGTFLGVIARILFPDVEAEMGLPRLIKEVLPVGMVGVVIAVYFSAIMSTADSCLLASVGNVVTDIVARFSAKDGQRANDGDDSVRLLRLSRILTVLIGLGSVSVALLLPKVLDAILLAYDFMVSGLFAPTVLGLYWKRATSAGAFAGIVGGGGLAVALHAVPVILSSLPAPWSAMSPVMIAAPMSALLVVAFSFFAPSSRRGPSDARSGEGTSR